MPAEHYLAVREVHLDGGGAWRPPNDGLFFLFLSQGTGCHSEGKLTRHLRDGEVLVLNQKANQNRLIAKSPGVAFQWFSLQVEQLHPFFDLTELGLLEDIVDQLSSLRPLRASLTQTQAYHRLVAKLPLEPSLEQRVQVLGIAAKILSNEFRKDRNRRPGLLEREEQFEKVFRTMSEADFLSLSVPVLAERFGCSRRHLNRRFHEFFGSSLGEFRMELRLKKVACLLRNPNMKIISVAEQCGFNHLSQFNARFKRRFGVSPALWRKQLAGNTARADGVAFERNA